MDFNTHETRERGLNRYGQLGDRRNGSRDDKHIPYLVHALDSETVVNVTCGSTCTFAYTSSGLIYDFGEYRVAKEIRSFTPTIDLGLSNKNVTSIDVQKRHCAFLTENGELFTWGEGSHGMLGHGDTSDQLAPRLVEGLAGIACKQVACSEYHSVVLTQCGKVYTFGCGEHGQLGHGDVNDKHLPTLVQALETKEIIQVQCGGKYRTLALRTSGYVYAWGDMDYLLRRENVLVSPNPKVLVPSIVHKLSRYNVVQLSSYSATTELIDPLSTYCAIIVDPSPSPIREAQRSQLYNKDHSDVKDIV